MSEVVAQFGYDAAICNRFADVVLPFEPMPHQVDGLHHVLYYHRFGLYFEPRTGKTLVMQMAAIFKASYGDRIMQVMPPGLLYQFRADYEKIKGHGLQIETLNQTAAVRKRRLESWIHERPNVVLLSSGMFKAHWKDLYLLGFRSLHFDEAHLVLQDENNQTSKAVKAFLGQHERNRLIISTGTPLPNRLEKAYNIITLTNPGAYRSRYAFEQAHVVRKTITVPGKTDLWGRPRQVNVVDYYTELPRLSKNVYHRGIHISQREVLQADAPNISIVECELSPQHRQLYRKVMKTRIVELEDGEVIDARSAQKLRQTALQLISCPEHFGGSPAHNSLYATLDGLLGTFREEGRKVVVFANFTRTVELLEHRFKDWQPVTVYGPNGPIKNARNVEEFKTSQACQMLIANPIAGGSGFTLGEVSKTIVFAEPVSSPGAFQQCVSRVLLVGQTEPVLCYIVRVVGTISEASIDHMIGKVRDINQVMRLKATVFDVLLGKIDAEAEAEGQAQAEANYLLESPEAKAA